MNIPLIDAGRARTLAAVFNTFDGRMQQLVNLALGEKYDRVLALQEIAESLWHYNLPETVQWFDHDYCRRCISDLLQLHAYIAQDN